MKNRFLMITGLSLLLAWSSVVHAEYTETMKPDGLRKNLQSDYGVSGKGEGDDSARFQQAIDEMSEAGGGGVIVPKGVYHVRDVHLKPDVHLLVDHEAVIQPFIEPGIKKMTMFNMGVGTERVRNMSIRGVGGQFTVQLPDPCPGMTVVRCGNVENFLISNIRINDSKSAYSSLAFGLSGPGGTLIDFPGNGTIKKCSAYNAHYGYGLVQTQAGKDLLFEELFSEGGIALRMETGWNRMNDLQMGGVNNIIGRNLMARNGHCAVLVGPHSMQNGVIKIDGVRSESCNFAVKIGGGYVNQHQTNPNLKPGTFGPGSFVRNIHAVYGTKAQHKSKDWRMLPPALQKLLTINCESKNISRGPSISAVLNEAQYPIEVSNVSYEGFDGVPEIITGKMRQDLMAANKTGN